MSSFDARSFWDRRHEGNFGPESVGYAGLGVPFNNWMYRVRESVLRRQLARLKINVGGMNIFDIGSGTGFYVRIWRAMGARSVMGSDFSPYAVKSLREMFPADRFIEFDVAAETMPPELDRFDIVSAIDMLYHIVEDGSYQRAFSNIARLVRPGGYFIFSENVTGSRETLTHQVSRTAQEVETALERNGFKTVSKAPMFVLMNRPLKSKSRLLRLHWRVVSGLVRRHPAMGTLVGPALYPFEIAATALAKSAPTTEIYVCRKT